MRHSITYFLLAVLVLVAAAQPSIALAEVRVGTDEWGRLVVSSDVPDSCQITVVGENGVKAVYNVNTPAAIELPLFELYSVSASCATEGSVETIIRTTPAFVNAYNLGVAGAALAVFALHLVFANIYTLVLTLITSVYAAASLSFIDVNARALAVLVILFTSFVRMVRW